MPIGTASPRSLMRYMWLSLATAVTTIGLKVLAAVITGSVGFLSDAMESGVNLIAAAVGLGALAVAAHPPDTTHEFGHGKAEYLSAGVEGALVFVAAGAILWTSIARLINPAPLEQAGWGLALSSGASLLNLAAGLLLGRAGRKHRSIALEADGKHLLTDVWTSVGVLLGIGLVALTGWHPLDPIVALLVGANILHIGISLVRRALSGLLDAALPAADLARLQAVLDRHRTPDVCPVITRSREAGRQRFVYLTLTVPEQWSVAEAHDLANRVEEDIGNEFPGAVMFTHIEPGRPAASPDPGQISPPG